MRRVASAGWLMAGVSALLTAACAQGPAPIGNMVRNPGFEESSGKSVSGWLPQNESNGELRIDTGTHAGGARALQLIPGAGNTRSDKPLGAGQQIAAAGLSGRRISIRAAMKTRGGAAAELLVFAVARNGKFIGTARLEQSEPSNEFVPRESSLLIDSKTTSIIVACGVTGTTGAAWFDDVFVGVENSPATEAAAPAGELTASIAIDARTIVRRLPKTLFGANVEWIFDAHRLWDPAMDQAAPVAAQAATQMGVGLIRFPGGVLADYYHWKDGVGPLAARPAIPFVVAPGVAKNSFGTDELLRFCRTLGAQPLLQVNVVTGSAAEAADWVTYTNNPGRPAGYRVHYWELGNEQYMKHPNGETARSYMKVQEYVAKAGAFADAMKARDPEIGLGAVSGINFGNYKIVEDPAWNRTVLEKLGARIDFIALHNGYAPVVIDGRNMAFDDVYRALLAFPVLLEEQLREVNRSIERYAPKDASRLRIAITEWGPLFAFSPESPWVGHTKTLGSALFAASVLQTLFRADRVDLAAFFQLLSSNNFSGWIDQRGYPKATARALEMYTRHFGSSLLRSSTTSPAFTAPPAGVVAAATAPYLDSVASLSEDGSKLYLTVINKSLTSRIRTSIRLEGFTAKHAATWILTGPSLDSNNGNDLPKLPGANWARQTRAPVRGMIDAGTPGTVDIASGTPIENPASAFSFDFAARSVTSLELNREMPR